jgi:steroid delta-isomerase-like uncharacterized protein
MNLETAKLLADYYAAFNSQDMTAFLEMLTEDVIHDINQDKRELGKSLFSKFMLRMNAYYKEQIVNISITTNKTGDRAAVEFTVLGEYLSTDQGLPEAKGQKYNLAAGAFFDIRDGKVARVTNYYNLENWLSQVVA